MSDSYLEECRCSGAVVTVITMNGFQMRGVVVAEDERTIVLLSDGKKQLIFKHAISTIRP